MIRGTRLSLALCAFLALPTLIHAHVTLTCPENFGPLKMWNAPATRSPWRTGMCLRDSASGGAERRSVGARGIGEWTCVERKLGTSDL